MRPAYFLIAMTSLAAEAGAQPEGPRPNIAELIRDLDENGDFRIERSEVPEKGMKAFGTLLKHGDDDGDGVLDAEEIRGLLFQMAGALAPNFSPESIRGMDKDGDGVVAREEYTGPDPLFALLDANKDGEIAKEEIERMAKAGGPGMGQPAAGPAGAGGMAARLKRLDANGDGRISREEFKGPQQLFDRLDANKDGAIGPYEMRAAAEPAASGPEADRAAMLRRLKGMDKDGDGKVDREEFQGPPPLFDRLDTNKDGAISPEDRPAGPPADPAGARKKAGTPGASRKDG